MTPAELKRRYHAKHKERLAAERKAERSTPAYRAKRNAYMKAWHAANPDKWRATNLLTHYGLTPSDYHALLVAQHGLCAICRATSVGQRRNGRALPLHVDHCHTTGRVRGLLCQACNRGIGFFKEQPSRIRAALAYLEHEVS